MDPKDYIHIVFLFQILQVYEIKYPILNDCQDAKKTKKQKLKKMKMWININQNKKKRR